MNKFFSILFAALGLSMAISCTKTDTPEQDDFSAKLTEKRVELQNLLDNSTYGDNKDEYPVSSKDILTAAIADLDATIADFNAGKGTKELFNKAIAKADEAIAAFKATINKDEGGSSFVPRPAELYMDGEFGWIDFGTHEEYSCFGEKGEQSFTIEFWLKATEMRDGNIGAYLSAFDQDPGDVRYGWFVNHFGPMAMRMSVGCGADFPELASDAFSKDNVLNTWIHFAAVVEADEVLGTYFYLYKNGELVAQHQGTNPYLAPKKPVVMTAFRRAWYEDDADAEPRVESFAQGCIKKLHIWKSAKDATEIYDIYQENTVVTGKEEDLVCGWDFDKTVEDEQNIPDITGKFTARLMGTYEWR